MKTTTVSALGLSILLITFASVPARADGSGHGGGEGHSSAAGDGRGSGGEGGQGGWGDHGGGGSGDRGGGWSNHGGGGEGHHGGGGGGGGSHGTPAPVAGLGLLALGAIRYGSQKLRKPRSEKPE